MKRLLISILLASSSVGAAPLISWVSSPAAPDSTVMVAGGGFGKQTKVQMKRLPDGARKHGNKAEELKLLQVSDPCLKFIIPPSWPMGMYELGINNGGNTSKRVLLNYPEASWIQGDQGRYATPNGWLRIVGQSLGFEGVISSVQLRRGKDTLDFPAEKLAYQQVAEKDMKDIEGEYALHVDLSAVASGPWVVWVHNGYGGNVGWSLAGSMEIKTAAPWPETVFTVNGKDHRAIGAALEKAKEHGGGVVFFPDGIYRPSGAIEVPPYTRLTASAPGRVELHWPGSKLATPPIALIHGKSHFAVENLTLIQRGHHAAGIMSENGFAEDGGGNVHLKNVVIRLNSLAGVGNRTFTDPVAELLDRGLIGEAGVGAKEPYGRVAAVMLGGENILLENVDVWSTGHPLILDGAGGVVKDCIFAAPIIGRYWIRACHRLILENNTFECGGAVASYNVSYPETYPFDSRKYNTTASRHLLFLGNRFFRSWKVDAEVMTVDSHPGVNMYSGAIESAGPDTIQLPKETMYVLAGEGVGDSKCRKVMEPGKTYLVTGRIDSFAGGKWDQVYASMYASPDEIGEEPEAWDLKITLRDDKRNLDHLAIWGTSGVRLTDYRLGKNYSSVIGRDKDALLFHEGFNYSNKDFQQLKTPWFKGGYRFDLSDEKNLGSPAPAELVDFGGSWQGAFRPSERALTFNGKGWLSAWRKLPAPVDVNVAQQRYFIFFIRNDGGRASFALGAADVNRRTPQDQYHGFAELSLRIGVGSAPTFKGQINERSAWHDALVFVADGKGRGQYRFLKSAKGGVLQLDRPWDVIPDKTSFVIIPKSFCESYFAANSFEDSGRLQMWGGSFGIVVDGNRFVRSSGLAVMGLEYYGGIMPAWRCKLLNNTRIGFNAASISGSPSQPFFGGPLAGLNVVRGNYDNAAGASGNIVDSVLEHNTDTLRPFKRDDLKRRRKSAGFVQSEATKKAGEEGLWLDNKKGLVVRNNRIIAE